MARPPVPLAPKWLAGPYLVRYGELPDEIKEYDRAAFRAIPALLADVGYAVTRVAPAADSRDRSPDAAA